MLSVFSQWFSFWEETNSLLWQCFGLVLVWVFYSLLSIVIVFLSSYVTCWEYRLFLGLGFTVACNRLVFTRCRLSHTRKEDVYTLHSSSIQSSTLDLQHLHFDLLIPLICFKIIELIFHKLQVPPLTLLELHSILPQASFRKCTGRSLLPSVRWLIYWTLLTLEHTSEEDSSANFSLKNQRQSLSSWCLLFWFQAILEKALLKYFGLSYFVQFVLFSVYFASSLFWFLLHRKHNSSNTILPSIDY